MNDILKIYMNVLIIIFNINDLLDFSYRHKRRKLIPTVSLHRLCRQPWSHNALPTELRLKVTANPAPPSNDVDVPISH